MVFREGVWSDPVSVVAFLLFVREPVNYIGFFFPHLWKLPSPRVRTAQLPSVTPEAAPESHQDPYGGENTFLGGRNDYHQSTQQWTDTFAQEAETSTSLVITKPELIENETRSEVSDCFLPRRRSCSIITALAIADQSQFKFWGRI